MTAPGLVLSDDLIFFSRISETARGKGFSVRQARTPAELVALAGTFLPGGVILDLQIEGLDLSTLLSELRAACTAMPRVIAYGSHVEAEVLCTARAAGCDQVLPRSQFVKLLEDQIANWLAMPA